MKKNSTGHCVNIGVRSTYRSTAGFPRGGVGVVCAGWCGGTGGKYLEKFGFACNLHNSANFLRQLKQGVVTLCFDCNYTYS